MDHKKEREDYVDRLYNWYLIQCRARRITPKAAAKIGSRLLGETDRVTLARVIKKEVDELGDLAPICVSGDMPAIMRRCIREALNSCSIKAKFGGEGDISYKMSVWNKVKLWFVISFIIDYIENLLSD